MCAQQTTACATLPFKPHWRHHHCPTSLPNMNANYLLHLIKLYINVLYDKDIAKQYSQLTAAGFPKPWVMPWEGINTWPAKFWHCTSSLHKCFPNFILPKIFQWPQQKKIITLAIKQSQTIANTRYQHSSNNPIVWKTISISRRFPAQQSTRKLVLKNKWQVSILSNITSLTAARMVNHRLLAIPAIQGR